MRPLLQRLPCNHQIQRVDEDRASLRGRRHKSRSKQILSQEEKRWHLYFPTQALRHVALRTTAHEAQGLQTVALQNSRPAEIWQAEIGFLWIQRQNPFHLRRSSMRGNKMGKPYAGVCTCDAPRAGADHLGVAGETVLLNI